MRRDGAVEEIPWFIRLDTVEDLDYWRYDGFLPFVWRSHLATGANEKASP